MREFGRLRAAGLPIPADVRARDVQASNDGYATDPDPGEFLGSLCTTKPAPFGR
jgi:hypothetical protein